MATTINLNEQVSFRLTDYGKAIYAKNYFLLMNRETTINLDDEMTISFWEFCAVFGDCLYIGNPNTVSVGNQITFVNI